MRNLDWSLSLRLLAAPLLLSACARSSSSDAAGGTHAGHSASVPAPSVALQPARPPAAAEPALSADSDDPLGMARRCTPLDQLLSRTTCVTPKGEHVVFPEGWNAAHESPPCTPAAAPRVLRVVLQQVRSGASLPHGSERCGWDYVLRVPALHLAEVVCASSCGPYAFVATRIAKGLAFECAADMEQTEGLIEFKDGALARQIWGHGPSVDWRAYRLPCHAQVVFEPHSQPFTGSSL